MAIDKLAAITGAGHAPAAEGAKESFGKALGQVARPNHPPSTPQPSAVQHVHEPARAVATARIEPSGRVLSGRPTSPVIGAPVPRHAANAIDRVTQAQRRLDHVLELAQSGRTFTPAELLAMQAQVYRASQEIDMAGKVVDKATAGVKQILQTQV